ncbi:MAG: hypothetical protein R3253_12615 [Longimicrobiales bacterium]|nr:hypothetical protein [Longimicrobiales bacterium]
MIMPVIRASFGRSEALQLVELLGRHDAELRDAARQRLEEGGLDDLLDDPRVLNALLTDDEVRSRPEIFFYVLVRQSMLERGVDDPVAADYVASMLVGFGQSRRAYRISSDSDEEYGYLVDLMARLRTAGGREAFLIRMHMGNFSLWLSGLFPDFLESRVRRKGAPPISYYERMGSTGYLMASESPEAATLGLEGALRAIARQFSGVRSALNRVSDRYLWRGSGDPVGRLLREVTYAME